MGPERFATNVTTQNQADRLVLVLRQRVSDAVIYFRLMGSVHICHIQINRDVADIARALFLKESFDCQKI